MSDTIQQSPLRAPDPTLDACGLERVGLSRRDFRRGERPPPLVAHRVADASGPAVCGAEGTLRTLTADAAYIAVACPVCFDDVPPTGMRHPDPDDPDDLYAASGSGWVIDPCLAWQVY